MDSSGQRGLRELLVHHDEGVIDEEFSAEVSLQDSSYTEFVSKPVSELRVTDDEDETGNSKSAEELDARHLRIDDELVASPTEPAHRDIHKLDEIHMQETAYPHKDESSAVEYRDQEALDEVETQRTKSMQNLLHKQVSHLSKQSKSYPKIEISEQDTKTDKGSQSWPSDKAEENAREFIEHRDLEETAFEDGDLPRESKQASPIAEQHTPTQVRAPPLPKLSEVEALNCQNYFKK